MLALTRKKNEAIIIGENIEIKILDIVGDKVKIGISAPKDVSIYREEIYIQVCESNKEASHISQNALQSIKNMINK